MKRILGLTIVLAALIIVLGACDDATTNPPTTGSISGTVTFTGEWPVGKASEADAVYVCVFKEWPINGIPYLSDPLPPPDADGLIPYTVSDIALGTYAVVGVWTYPQYEFCGAYGYTDEGDIPTPITLTEENPHVTGIDFDANYSGPAETGSISGHVTFSGSWPEGNVRVMAFETWPPTGPPQMTDPISESDGFDYTIADVPYNTYEVVGLFDSEDPPNMYGAYGYDPPGDTTPDPVTVDGNNPDVTGIDFSASN